MSYMDFTKNSTGRSRFVGAYNIDNTSKRMEQKVTQQG